MLGLVQAIDLEKLGDITYQVDNEILTISRANGLLIKRLKILSLKPNLCHRMQHL